MLTPPSSEHLPRHIEPRRLAGQGVDLLGIIKASNLERLHRAVEKVDSPADVNLSFDIDEQGIRTVTGHIAAEVELICQRCLETVKQRLDVDVQIGIVWSEEQASQLPTHLEPWILSDEDGDLYQLIEDELILSLPMFANHEEADCQGRAESSTGEPAATTAENPFNILEQLKH